MTYSLRSRVVKGIAGGIAFAAGGTAGALITRSGGGAFGGGVLCVVLVESAINFYENPQSLKFSIRDLLLVTMIVALAVGWWVERNRLAEASGKLKGYEEFLENLEPGDYVIVPEGRPHDGKIHFTVLPNSPAPAPNPPKP